MKQFTLDPEIIRSQTKKSLLLIAIVAATVNLAVVIYIYGTHQEAQLVQKIIPSLITTILVGSLLASGTSRNAARLQSYVLTINEQFITREVGNFPMVQLALSEITGIHKNANGTFTIKGPDPKIFIHVPAFVLQKTELEQLLAEIQPLSEETVKTQKRLPRLVYMFGMLALIVVFYTVKNKWIFAPAGIIVMGVMIISSVQIIRHPLLSNSYKARVALYALVIISMCFVLYTKLKMA